MNDHDEEGHYHHHLICLGCGKVWECKDDLLETLETILQKQFHFQTVDHQLKVYGYCEDCQKKRAAAAQKEAEEAEKAAETTAQ